MSYGYGKGKVTPVNKYLLTFPHFPVLNINIFKTHV